MGDWPPGQLNGTHICKRTGLLAVGPKAVLLVVLGAFGVAISACCTSSGRATLSMKLAWEPCSSGFFCV